MTVTHVPRGGLQALGLDPHFAFGKNQVYPAGPQAGINHLLIDEARAGQTVVRLTDGDPFLFERGGEEAEAPVEAGIAFEVVPGVSAGVAVPAYAGIPPTHRDVTAEVVFLTGHDSATSPSTVGWACCATSPATLAVFMGLGNLRAIARLLLDHGRDARYPAAVVAPLGEIAGKAAEAGIQTPALIVVGDVAGLRDRLQ
jgi:uroporphyrinogen III methyltransferase / synthase